MHIRKMQSRRRLIQNIDSFSGAPFTQFGCQFDTLCFSAGQCCGRLTEPYIRQSHIVQCLNFPLNRRHIFKKGQCLLNSHVQHIIYAFSFIFDLQCFTVIPFSLTYFTRYIHIRQKMHFNLQDAITGTCLAASPFDIEAETPFFVAPCFRIRRCCKQITDLIKHTGISRRIGTRCSSDWRLINTDDFIQLLQAINTFVFTRNTTCTVQCPRQMLVQNLIDQRTFSGA